MQAFDNRQLEDRIENTSLLSLYTCLAQQYSLFPFYFPPWCFWIWSLVASCHCTFKICPFFVQYLLKPFDDETPLLVPILSSHHYIRPAWKYPLSLWILWGFMWTSSVLHDIWKVLIVFISLFDLGKDHLRSDEATRTEMWSRFATQQQGALLIVGAQWHLNI